MAKRYKLGSSIAGYDRAQVDTYIDSLLESNMMKLEEMRRRVNECRNEKDRLHSHYINKQREMENYKKSRKYMEFALKRAESAVGLINSAAENERRELDEACRAKLDEYDKEIEKLSEEANNRQEHLNFLIRRATKARQNKALAVDDNGRAKGDNRIDAQAANTGEASEGLKNSGFWDEYSYEDGDTRAGSHAGGHTLNGRNQVKADDMQALEDSKVPGRDFSSSPALSADINQVRNKYLVGKIAGEDLMARDGSLIISKNDVISSDIIVRAEKEGKLAELIINMVLPGMES